MKQTRRAIAVNEPPATASLSVLGAVGPSALKPLAVMHGANPGVYALARRTEGIATHASGQMSELACSVTGLLQP
jgi:hypothetical protein